ncbi:MAG TPA: helix-turn-helix domain-containing protein [Allosphingosinicella sp.]|jgi:transcriptional regulator with XRE-family HTH domain|nr:helix-turn-helix domain-containing protein [Allosphingosinicella sp.]
MADSDQDQLLGQSVGERLRVAREAKKLSLDDVARQTRIPVRHLEHIEREEWEALPAITYSVGFARSYANTVDLDGAQIGAEVRQQLGGVRPGNPAAAPFYEPADPARVPPRSLAIAAAVLAVLLVIGYLVWRSSAVADDSPADVAITQSEQPAAGPAAPRSAAPVAPAPAPANGPVVLTAVEDVWLRIDQAGGGAPLYMGTLKAGQSYQVPPGAQSPRIRTARANMLRVSVGGTQVPPLGPPETTISNVSLTAPDLLARAQGGAATPAAPTP